MKICNRGLNFIQVLGNGDVRVCAWNYDHMIGNLLEQDFYDIYHGEKADKLRKTLIDGTYENCPRDGCPYLANGTIADELVEIDQIPDYPEEIYLAYDQTCNYKCISCFNCNPVPEEFKHNSEIIEKRLKPVLEHVKMIGANGTGELFASKSILKILKDWKPKFPPEEVRVSLETNGSLFDKTHWEMISNLGQYHLKVNITIMSFEEGTYQFLSGTKLPISQLEDNLRFVKELRKEGIINELELATVMQEYNFREVPELARRCIEDFGADVVRIRPYQPWGVRDASLEWFFDIRNPEHPYYPEYQRIMALPIMQHPKVWVWAGDLSSNLGPHPFSKVQSLSELYSRMLHIENFTEKFQGYLHKKNVTALSVYGIERAGRVMIDLLQKNISIPVVYDKRSIMEEYNGIPIRRPNFGSFDGTQYILITVAYKIPGLKEELIHKSGLEECNIEYLEEVLYNFE